jgi:hypothetical protein
MSEKLHIKWIQNKGRRSNENKIMSDMEQCHLKDNLAMVLHVMTVNMRENKPESNSLAGSRLRLIYDQLVKKLECFKIYSAVTQHSERMVEVKRILKILADIKIFIHTAVQFIDILFVKNIISNESPMMKQRNRQKANILYALRMVENMTDNVKTVF